MNPIHFQGMVHVTIVAGLWLAPVTIKSADPAKAENDL